MVIDSMGNRGEMVNDLGSIGIRDERLDEGTIQSIDLIELDSLRGVSMERRIVSMDGDGLD